VRALLGTLLQPIGLGLVLVIAGVMSGVPAITLAGAILLWLLSTPVVSEAILGPLERRFAPVKTVDCPQADAVVVVSGNIINGVNRADVQWGPAASRFHEGVRLMREGKASLLILAGAPSLHDARRSQGEILRDAAVEQGIDASQILITAAVATTSQEARAVTEVCRGRGISNIVLVTSAWHMPRAVRLFRATGLSVSAFPVDQRVHKHARITMSRLLPRARTLADSDAAVHEYLGLLRLLLRRT